MSSKDIRKRIQALSATERNTERSDKERHKTSPYETSGKYQLELSMEEYGRLMRRALQEGCKPEELVAQAIENLLQE